MSPGSGTVSIEFETKAANDPYGNIPGRLGA